ncbi:hypothetical protein V1525DRAFT_400187 [Lipomyces kononenkoae]|uniref:Uncharacterized protein n=1 Tax=Lipomyces kononenkoae TaxID=34357 RepID=A0ACC3T422_LIPKO
MESQKRFVDNVDTFLSAIPPAVIQQVMSPAAPDVSGRLKERAVGTNPSATNIGDVRWEKLQDVGSILGCAVHSEGRLGYNQRCSMAYLDLAITLGDKGPGLLGTKDAQHIWKSMESRYRQTTLTVRWVAKA